MVVHRPSSSGGGRVGGLRILYPGTVALQYHTVPGILYP